MYDANGKIENVSIGWVGRLVGWLVFAEVNEYVDITEKTTYTSGSYVPAQRYAIHII